MGVSRCRPQPGRQAQQAQQAHTSGVSPGLSYPLAPTSNTKRSRLQASQRTVQLGGQIEDGLTGSFSKRHTVYKRRDGARGPALPRKQYAYRAAPAHVHSAHAAYQLLEHRMHSQKPPTPRAGLARVFCCVLLHVCRGVILDLAFRLF